MRWIMAGVTVGASVLAVSLAAAAPLNTLYAVTRVTGHPKGQPALNLTTKYWFKSGKLRTENGPNVVIIDGKNQIVYSLKDPKKQAIVGPAPPRLRVNNTTALLTAIYGPLAKMKKMGTASVMGHPTSIIELPSGGPGQSVKMWLATDLGAPLPLKAEMKGPQGNATNQMITLQVNPSIPDSMFAAPAGYKKVAPPTPRSMMPVAPPKKK